MTNAVAQMATLCLYDGGILSLRDRPYRGELLPFPLQGPVSAPSNKPPLKSSNPQ